MWFWTVSRKRWKRLEGKVDAIMATLDEQLASINSVLGEIGTEIGKVAADTQSLLDKIASFPTTGITPEQQTALDSIQTSVISLRDSLKSLDDKVPDPTPPSG